MIETIAQAYRAVTRHYQTAANALNEATSARDINILKTEKAALGAIASMLKGLQSNPRVEHVSLKSLDNKSEDEVRTILSYKPYDPDADTTQMQLDRFERKLTTFAQNLRRSQFFASIAHRHIFNGLEVVLHDIHFIRQKLAEFRRANNYNDQSLPPLERQKKNRDILYSELLHLRKYLSGPLTQFYGIKADIDLYCARHPHFKQLMTEIDVSLNDLFDAICAGSRSIELDISDNPTISQQYSLTQTYQFIISAIPHLRLDLQSMLREVLVILNHLTCLRNTLNIPVKTPEESEQSILAKYAREQCDGVLLLPLAQALDVNVANALGLCGGFARSFIKQLASGTGLFALINKIGPMANIENSTQFFHFYNSTLREVNLQNTRDIKVTDYEPGQFPRTNMMPLDGNTIKKTNSNDMKRAISEKLDDPSQKEFFSRLSFWERNNKIGHGVALCYMNNQVHFMDANYGYFRFDTKEGFLNFFDRYAEMCIPDRLHTINLDTYVVAGVRPKASASSSSSSSNFIATKSPLLNMLPMTPGAMRTRRASFPEANESKTKTNLHGLSK
jgi:hypothetical protein